MRRALSAFAAILCLAALPLHAQAPGEVTFWESVRDSKNPDELRAYLQTFPNGMFAPLARARLAALEQKPAPAASVPVPAGSRLPQAGDSWTYRLSYPRLRGQWGQPDRAPSTHAIKVGMASAGEIVDQISVAGGAPSDVKHRKGGYLLSEGASIFSPYLAVFESIAPGQRVPDIEILDAGCLANYRCEAKTRRVTLEIVTVPAGRFETLKVTVEQEWTPFSIVSTAGSAGADMTGGRTLTVWYSPQAKRAVKYSSRLVAGAIPPMDANFDLELVSYQLK